MKLQQGTKLLMIGDSITDVGRVRPIGEGRGEALGKGYVAEVNALIQSVYPDLGIRVVNMGTSGNTVRSLKERWTTDVLDLKPDWLSIMIGINDVWRQFDQPLLTETHVLLEEYEATLEELVSQTLPALEGLILMTPYFLEANENDAMRSLMDQYGAVVRRLAEKYGTQFIDTQAAFRFILSERYNAELAWDRVHPSLTGHMILARAFLREIGFDWNREV
ncbi:MAG: family lipase [Paenibacillus sp.]|jgi:lysophospholipase L1-like esterase|nr:family lipase [Paenibacillus sp.]